MLGRDAGHRDIGAGAQAALGLQPLEGQAVGEQEDIGARGAGGDLGAQPGHDLAGAAADPFDLYAGVAAAEGLHRAGGIGFELGGVEHQLPRHILRRRRADRRHGQPGRPQHTQFAPAHDLFSLPHPSLWSSDLRCGRAGGGRVKNVFQAPRALASAVRPGT